MSFSRQYIGRTLTVLFERGMRDGFQTGTTGNFLRVAVAAEQPLAGTIHEVTITGIMDGLVYANLGSAAQARSPAPVLVTRP
jgi:hypothetical protein